ncbi:hypothetical protein RU09_06065 [Microbacterium sp. MEJ108Y]|uniref:hypothetical protein n=1 Tax=Microbacterium sp. MEJ108Y TaxID=1587523 RepID=UPI0005AC69D3|nr:hypothetical protein [Microbacterium sp. MEJ108Y]KIP93376.1 hypothetical protein RU09_06065 [Microbacterium sp. MEJ108Y]
MFELWTHDAITGDERKQVFPAAEGAQWSVNLTGTGTCTFVFVVNDAETGMDGAEIDATFAPNSTLLSLQWGTTVMGAWKIEDWDYDEDKGTVTVTGVELRNEAAWRMTYGVSNYEAGTLAVVNRNRQGAVRAILARFMQWSPEWAYPIDLPADGAGTFTQTWQFWKKLTIQDLLTQVEDDGVEVFLRPYLTAARQLRFQTIVAVKVSVGTSYFHLQAEDRPLSGVHYKKSGAEQLTGLQGIGTGSGQDQPVAWSGGGPYLIPIRDAKREFPDLEGTRLQSATNATLADLRNPIVQWTVSTFTASDEHPPSEAVVGRGWQLQSEGHPQFPDGTHTVRVIAASGSFSNVISVEVQSGIA